MSKVQNPRVKPNPAIFSTVSVARGSAAASESIVKAYEAATGEVDGNGDATAAAVTAAALETFYKELRADGNLSTDECVQFLNPAATIVDIYFDITVTGEVAAITEAELKAIVYQYVNTLGLGADVDASALSALIAADAGVALVGTLLLLDGVAPTVETADITIGAAELAKVELANIAVTIS